MTTLEKLARSTLVAPPAPPAQPPTPPRVIKTVTLVPLYSETYLPVSEALPGDKIITLSSSFFVPGSTAPKVVTRTYAVRSILIGYNNIVTYEVIPGTVAVPVPPPAVVTPVPSAWDSTAWSITAIATPLEASWKVGTSTAANTGGSGAIVGLTYFAPEVGEEQRSIVHGIRVQDGIAYVHTAPPEGVPVATTRAHEVLVPFLDVTDGQEMRIRVEGDQVSYFCNDILMATGPSYLGANPVRLGAVLFSPLDTVTEPAITALAAVNGAAAFRVVGQGGQRFNFGRAEIRLFGSGYQEKNRALLKIYGKGGDRPMGVGSAGIKVIGLGWGDYVGVGSGASTLRVAGIGGDYAYAFGAAAIVLSGNGSGAAPNTNLRAVAVPEDFIGAELAPGPHGGLYPTVDAEASFDATVISGAGLAASARVATRMRVSQVYFENLAGITAAKATLTGERVVDVVLLVETDAEITTAAVLVITASLGASVDVEAELTPSLVMDASLNAEAEVQFDWTAGRVMNAAITALARAGVVVHMPGENLQVWSVNKDTGGSTAYEQYPFNSFACIGGRYFGAAPGGIFELVGDTDDGEQAIDAVVNLGKRDFGSGQLKGITNAYLNVSSPEKMQVRVTTPEGAQYTYEARSSADHMRTQRVDFGRGLRAHYLGLEIMNTNGCEFDLEAAEFLVAEMKRRI